MKCVEVGAPATVDGLRVVDRPTPAPGPGEVLVRIRASSLNFHDYLVAAGVLPAAAGRVLLSDGAGEVVEPGEGATLFQPGDRVIGTYFPDWLDGPPTDAGTARMRGDHADGFGCEFVALPERHFTRAPRELSFEQAAALPCAGLTAWRALVVEGRIKPGDRVLVQGSGGVASFAAQFAVMAGATVFAISSSEAKADHLRALGVRHVINYLEQPEWGKRIRELSEGGVDHVVEVVGGDLTQSMRSLRTGGALYLVGALSRKPIQFASLSAIKGNLRIVSLTVGSRAHQEDMVRAIEAQGLKPSMDRSFGLHELALAFERMSGHGHVGNIAISI
jgi:NADPH:quinone reductase-like Zn-dependent oxidoreductase